MKGIDIMARETQKEKIERLEKSLSNANEIIQKLNNEISEMIDKADNSFENSSTYKQMARQIETLELKVKAITDTAEHNRKMYEHELRINEKLYMQSKSNEIDNNNSEIINQKLQSAQESSDKWHKEFLKKKQEYESLKENYDKVEKENQKLINENIELKNNTNIHKVKNERGAGRKREITDKERADIRQQRATGKTIKDIAIMFNRSVGIVHKIITEKSK